MKTAQRWKNATEDVFASFVWRIGCGDRLPLFNYSWKQVFAQFVAVGAVSCYVAMFRLLIARSDYENAAGTFGGLLGTVVGLSLLMEGIKFALHPIGESVGSQFASKVSLPSGVLVCAVAAVLGTLAEPTVISLSYLGVAANPAATFEYLFLNRWMYVIMLAMGGGVSLCILLGLWRVLRGYSLKPFIFAAAAANLVLTVVIQWGTGRARFALGFVWDSGMLVAGPVTVPLVAALSNGLIAKHARERSSAADGFAVSALSSLHTVFVMQLVTLLVSLVASDESLEASAVSIAAEKLTWYEVAPVKQLIASLRAIVPLALFLAMLVELVVKGSWPALSMLDIVGQQRPVPPPVHPMLRRKASVEQLPEDERPMIERDSLEAYDFQRDSLEDVAVDTRPGTPPSAAPAAPIAPAAAGTAPAGAPAAAAAPAPTSVRWQSAAEKKQSVFAVFAFLASLGLVLYGIGLSFGVVPLGHQTGSSLRPSGALSDGHDLGTTLVLVVFAFLLGCVCTVAQPALRAFAAEVEQVTNGELRQLFVMISTASGAGFGITLGLLRILNWAELVYFLITGYLLAAVLSHFLSESLVKVAWDSSSIVTDTFMAPLLIAVGLGLAETTGEHAGSGILTLCSMSTVCSVMLAGVVLKAVKRFASYRASQRRVMFTVDSVDIAS
eukprot:TRINITY_DN6138_c0_g1_i3.p1 TRINITY_DN6138_c0_g1~~TRINITY_DN6138_c0_g1_i3.p1  ORF type:complete len:667 (+),score=166.79 TRINITY_DN6138_c0_g1_i3:155-2155(+)